jgi:hypothetical protein
MAGTASASSAFLAANSPLGEKSLATGFAQVAGDVSAELLPGSCGSCLGCTAEFLVAPSTFTGTMDTIPAGQRIMLRPVEIEFPARGLSPAEQQLVSSHLAEQELRLNQLSLNATSDLESNLLNYQNIKPQVDASRALARQYLPGSGAGLDAAHSLDTVAGGYLNDFAGFRSPIQQRIGSLWRTRTQYIQPGQVHRLVPKFD